MFGTFRNQPAKSKRFFSFHPHPIHHQLSVFLHRVGFSVYVQRSPEGRHVNTTGLISRKDVYGNFKTSCFPKKLAGLIVSPSPAARSIATKANERTRGSLSIWSADASSKRIQKEDSTRKSIASNIGQ